MSYFKSEEDFKGQLEHDIEWAEGQIKTSRGWIEQSKERLKRISDADTIKSIRSSIKTIEGTIKDHRQRIERWRQNYEQRYGCRYGEKPKKRPTGKQKLTVIRGGKKADDGLSDEFRVFLQRERGGADRRAGA